MKFGHLAKGVAGCVFAVIAFFIFLPISTAGEEGVSGAAVWLHASLYGFCDEVDVSDYNITPDDLYGMTIEILKDDPYMFFVSPTFIYEADEHGRVLRVFPQYLMSKEEYDIAAGFCRLQVRSILNIADGVEDEAEIALRIHDYLCLNYTYDEALEACNMFDFFKSGKGTCQGYTFAYMACLRAAGLECSFAASDSISHIWNTVCIGGEWYHVDVTWDDYPEVWGGVDYECFLKSDLEISRSGHRDWYTVSGTVCGSDVYDGADFKSFLFEYISDGDLNGDGDIDVLDLVLCQRGRGAPVGNCFIMYTNGDIDLDGVIGEGDIRSIQEKILN